MKRAALLLLCTVGAAQAAENRFPQPVRAGTLAGRIVQWPDESQAAIGHVRTVARQPNGPLLVIMDRGGWLARFGGVFGWGAHPVAVKLADVALLGTALVLVGLSPAEFQALPRYEGGAAPLDGADTVAVGLAKPSH